MKALDIKYRDVDGAKYPELQISKNPEADRIPLGKYGQICLNFIKEEYPDRYAELRMSGDLMPLMHEVNEEAYRQGKDLTEKLMKKEQFDKSDTMARTRIYNTCQAEAESIVLNEFVYQPR